MTTDANPILSPESLRSALTEAKTLFDPRWLDRQGKKRPQDPAHIDPRKLLKTIGQIRHAVKHGAPKDELHPIAEAILVAERSLAELDKKQPSLGSKLFYRVLSLADIARFRQSIGGIDKRITKLTGPEWKSALYELVTACGYAAAGVPPEFIEETTTPTPDIKLRTDPFSYVECKTKPQYEQEVIDFTDIWMRKALLPIKVTLHQHSDSFIIRIVILSPHIVNGDEIPNLIREMIENGQQETEVAQSFNIKIERRPAKRQKLSKPLPLQTEVWKIALNFDEWDDWHYLSPDGKFALLNSDPRFVTAIGKADIVCVRAEYLMDNRVSLLNTLKDACKRQFAEHKPGIIHVLINAKLFGLGQLRDPEVIRSVLEPEVKKVLNDYDRLWQILIDVISESDADLFKVTANRFVSIKRSVPTPGGYVAPKPIIII